MHPAPGISAAMIVRDEEAFLDGCLDTLVGRVDEIVIVDTGSTDQTVRIAHASGAVVVHHEWSDDFSAARNVALGAATKSWILYIDADERLRLPNGGRLFDYIDPRAGAGFVRFRPKSGFTRYREWRLFRNDPRIRFTGRIHETIVPDILRVCEQDGLSVVQTDVEIDHLGYDGPLARKHARNLPLLLECVQAQPDRVYYWQQLAETLDALGRADEALDAAGQGLAHARADDLEKQIADASMLFQLVTRLRMARGEDALPIINEGLARSGGDFALLFLKGRALLARGEASGALAIAERLLATDARSLQDGLLAFDERIFAGLACELAALSCLKLGRREDAAAYYRKAAVMSPDEPAYALKAVALGGGAARPKEGFTR